ncbi:hypothetical protein X275_00715 [Marinitoga sp. 1197]|uniref:hypothetical protein n=1 Tax=Marinitoga sp. 1197 TaxID=1428449 RepID=UPI000640D267|nr:hypothetical protein [Marinitoga sp. 1197]KLO24239.1 hypothetical protein X275_00715 [Marinitoga sp. 1197]
MRKINLIIFFILLIIIVFPNPLEILYDTNYNSEKDVWNDFFDHNYLKIIKSKNTDNETLLAKAFSYYKIYDFEKSFELLKKLDQKIYYEYFRLRYELIYENKKSNLDIINQKIEKMNISKSIKNSEKNYLAYILGNSSVKSELKKAFEESKVDLNKEKVYLIDVEGFNYAYSLYKSKDYEEAMDILTQTITYDFKRKTWTLDFDITDLQKTDFGNKILFSVILSEYAHILLKRIGIDERFYLKGLSEKKEMLTNIQNSNSKMKILILAHKMLKKSNEFIIFGIKNFDELNNKNINLKLFNINNLQQFIKSNQEIMAEINIF